MHSDMIPIGRIGEHLGHPVNPATPHRWRVKGILHNGKRVRLVAKRIGARYFVSEADLQTFLEALNVSETGSTVQDSVCPIAANAADIDKQLDAFGV